LTAAANVESVAPLTVMPLAAVSHAGCDELKVHVNVAVADYVVTCAGDSGGKVLEQLHCFCSCSTAG